MYTDSDDFIPENITSKFRQVSFEMIEVHTHFHNLKSVFLDYSMFVFNQAFLRYC